MRDAIVASVSDDDGGVVYSNRMSVRNDIVAVDIWFEHLFVLSPTIKQKVRLCMANILYSLTILPYCGPSSALLLGA
jgi:hypothetical protein